MRRLLIMNLTLRLVSLVETLKLWGTREQLNCPNAEHIME